MPPMDHAMMDGTMMGCAIACAVISLVILVCVVIQTVVQVKLLREIRKRHGTADAIGRMDIGSATQ